MHPQCMQAGHYNGAYDECFGTSFTDYLTLIKHENRWQIVIKAFFDQANA